MYSNPGGATAVKGQRPAGAQWCLVAEPCQQRSRGESPSSRRSAGRAGGQVAESRARCRAGDEAAEIKRPRGRRAMQARTRTLIFSLREMGNLGNPAEQTSPASGCQEQAEGWDQEFV